MTEYESVLLEWLNISNLIAEMAAGANTFIQKRICTLHLGCTFCFYPQLHRKYNWRGVELNTFDSSFYKNSL